MKIDNVYEIPPVRLKGWRWMEKGETPRMSDRYVWSDGQIKKLNPCDTRFALVSGARMWTANAGGSFHAAGYITRRKKK